MELAVLGNSSRYLASMGAGTSYLLTHGDTRLLLDCGHGTHVRLAQALAGKPLTAVLLSHFHVHTAADLFPVAQALTADATILAPRGALPRLAELLHAHTMDSRWLEPHAVRGISHRDAMALGSMRLRFARGGHGCPAIAARIETDDGTLVYLGDTGPRPWLVAHALGADALVAHTLLLDRDAGTDAARWNLTAGAAGRLAREAGAKRLAVSHIPFYAKAEESAAEARAAFGGDVTVLREGDRLLVSAR